MSARDTIIAELGLPSVESIIERVIAEVEPADFYDCRDSEEITHEHPWDSIDDFCEWAFGQTRWDASDGPPEVIVHSFARDTISDEHYRASALRAAERIIEDLEDDFGGDHRDGVEAAEKALATELEGLIRKHYPQRMVWRCREVGEFSLTEEECWSLAIAECWDDDLDEWVAAAKAWLASPEVVADAERAERQRRAEEGRESKPEPYGSVVGEWAVPPVREPEKPGTVKHTTVGGVGCVGRLRRA